MDVLMPQLGETVAEGKIVKWFKQAGDAVTPGENLFEIETDKTSMEVPSITSGTLTDIRFGVGETAKVGAVVAIISGSGEAAAVPALRTAAQEKPIQIPLTPAKAGVQKEAGLDSRIRGNERSVERGGERDFSYPNMTAWREVRTPERNYGPAKLTTGTYVTPLARRLASERGIGLNRIAGSGPNGRIVAADIAKAPAASAGTGSAQFTLVADVDVGRVIAMRGEAKAAGAEFTISDFVIKAWAAALKRITPEADTDIGLVRNVDGKRVTSMVSDAASKSLTNVAKEALEDIAAGAAATTAVHILSKAGIREATAVVTPPFTSVLAAGEPRRVPVEGEGGAVKFVSQMTVTLSCDPQAIDSAVAEELLASFKTMIENPVAALV